MFTVIPADYYVSFTRKLFDFSTVFQYLYTRYCRKRCTVSLFSVSLLSCDTIFGCIFQTTPPDSFSVEWKELTTQLFLLKFILVRYPHGLTGLFDLFIIVE